MEDPRAVRGLTEEQLQAWADHFVSTGLREFREAYERGVYRTAEEMSADYWMSFPWYPEGFQRVIELARQTYGYHDFMEWAEAQFGAGAAHFDMAQDITTTPEYEIVARVVDSRTGEVYGEYETMALAERVRDYIIERYGLEAGDVYVSPVEEPAVVEHNRE